MTAAWRGGADSAAVVRTPEERFADLSDYPFEPRYAPVRAEGLPALRMHYAEAGPRDAPVVLLMHGQPTWSYMYRRTMAVLVARGLRVVAPDNIGFGRSDKPTDPTAYTFRRHVEWTTSFLEALDLRAVTLVVHDWGGPIGLSALAAGPGRFARVVATNTVLHTTDPALDGTLTWANHGTGDSRVVLEEALVDYVLFCQRTPELLPSSLLYSARGPLPRAVLDAYDAPFPDPLHRAGLRQMTSLIPLTRNDPGAAAGRATMGGVGSLGSPLPDGLLRRRPGHPGVGVGVPPGRTRGRGAAPPHHRRRRALRPRGGRRGARHHRRRLRRDHGPDLLTPAAPSRGGPGPGALPGAQDPRKSRISGRARRSWAKKAWPPS